jgi:RHS repeat-associated protein
MLSSGEVYYYHYDGLGSVAALTDVNGTFVEYYEYNVFGEPIIWDVNAMEIVDSSVVGNPYMFTGREFDSESGNYYYRARYYSPKLGRFLQTDPIRYAAGLNLYTYVHSNPVNWTDPTGLKVVVVGDEVSVARACCYLWNSSRFIETFTYLHDRPETYTIMTNSNDDDRYRSRNIYWDPTSALKTTGGGKQTPALGLAHELEHARNDASKKVGSLTYDPSNPYENEEERNVITGPETDIANELGEDTRNDHYGNTYKVDDPRERENKKCK